MNTTYDPPLVARARTGDRQALTQLIERYEHRTYLVAIRILGNHEDASDAVQTAHLRLCKHIRHFRGDAHFSTWLHRIVTNACMDEIRRRRRLSAALQLPEGDLNALPLPDSSPGPEQAAMTRELQRTVRTAISRLPHDLGLLVELRELRGYRCREISQMLGVPEGTIKSRMYRARILLRESLRHLPLAE